MDQLEVILKKIIPREELSFKLAFWNFKGYRVVFTNGCFDILHRGHIEYLAHARSLGDILVVGLNTDNSVRKLKGEDRPLQDQESRALQLASLAFVTAVVLFEEDTPEQLISMIHPAVLVKGGDYRKSQVAGADLVEAYGGKVKIIPFVEGHSTSSLISKIKR